MQDNRLTKFLSDFHCNSPVFPNEWKSVIRVQEDATIGDAFLKLIRHKILSLVVVDSEKRPLYLLSVRDIIGYVLSTFKEEELSEDTFRKIYEECEQLPQEQKAKGIMNRKLSETVGKSKWDPVLTVPAEAPLSDAFNLMIQHKAHRVVVVGEGGELDSLITQSRILAFVNVMGLNQAEKTVEDLQLGTREVVCVRDNEKTYSAFRLIIEKGIGGVGVIDKDGVLVGNISTSDVKLIGWNAEYWSLLGMPVSQYLRELANHPEFTIRTFITEKEKKGERPPQVIHCRKSDKVRAVIKVMCYFNIHRIFVVDDERKPTGVISMFDILQAMTKS